MISLFCMVARSGGQVNCSIDSSVLDPAYPVMSEWAKAGVVNGIPPFEKWTILCRLDSSADLQRELDNASRKGGGIVWLIKGTYILRKPLRIHSNLVVRGAERTGVILSVKIHGYHFTTGRPRQSALLLENISGAGIENLTVMYTDASFEPLDKDSLNASWDERIFHKPELRDTTLFVEHIWIDSSINCWVRNCNLIAAGNDPLRISNSSHITATGNYIDRAYNKNDGGMGYYDISNSSYVLITGETIRRIRHLAIQNNSKYNVVVKNYLEVDINFHNGDNGYNLIEANVIRIPVWHSWHCFQRGDPGQHLPPGESNVLFGNDALYKNGLQENSNNNLVYLVNHVWNGKRIIETNLPVPIKHTFYAGCKLNDNRPINKMGGTN